MYTNNNAIEEIPNTPINTDLIFKGKVVPLIIEKPNNKDSTMMAVVFVIKEYKPSSPYFISSNLIS